MRTLREAGADLLLGGRCVGCDRPGRVLCEACRTALPTEAGPRWPSPAPAGLATPYATAAYADVVRAMLLGHKERGLVGLRPVLGDLLAIAVAAATASVVGVEHSAPGASVVLVPVPSRAASVRARGEDPVRVMTQVAGRSLRRAGLPLVEAPLLRLRRGVVDQAGLDRAQRRANLAGSMACRPRTLARLARADVPMAAVVCDDVLTTGSTAREAQRALEAVGVPVLAIACVAATQRRGAGGAAGAGEGSSTALLPPHRGRD